MIITFKDFEKVGKHIARRMYNRGYDVYLLQCNVSRAVYEGVSHDYDWLEPVKISRVTCIFDMNKFDRSIREYIRANCSASLGYYPHYYVTEEDYNKYMEELKYANQSY